jgi:type I restriction enzyme S subunit
MEVRKDYKQTEIGLIPEDWGVGSIGDLAIKVGSGITPTGGEKVYKNEGRPFIRSQNVGWGNLLLDDMAFIDEETHSTFPATEIKLNDVLLNITGASIGRSAIADKRIENGNVNQHVCIIRVDKSKLVSHYINLFLLSKMGQKQIDSFQSGGNRQGLNFVQIRSFRFPLPPLAEQEAIAEALSDADALIEAVEQLLTKKRQVKQGAMSELLTGKMRLSGFSGEWEPVSLIDLLTQNATYGIVKAGEFQDTGVPMVRGGDIKGGKISTSDIPFVTEEKSNEFSRTILKVNDVVIALVGYPGEAAKVTLELEGANISRAVGLLMDKVSRSRTIEVWQSGNSN